MDDGLLQERIRNVLEELELMIERTEQAATGSADHLALAAIADCLTGIRLQLTELVKAGAVRLRPGQSAVVMELTKRYFRLEGRIKELRNDRETMNTRGFPGTRAGSREGRRRIE